MLRTQGGEDELIETAGIKLNSRNIPQLLKVKCESSPAASPPPPKPREKEKGEGEKTLNIDIWNQQFE